MTSPHTYVIAEAGVNHNGSLATAIELVNAAFHAGADAVKFQTFRAEDVVTPDADAAEYQKINTGQLNQFDLIKALELDDHSHQLVAAHCQKIGIEFFSTPFSDTAVHALVKLGVKRLKLPSGEITNRPLIECAASTGLPILMSSGMSTLNEVADAVGWISEVWRTKGAKPRGPMPLVVMHCTSAYPAPANSLNLKALTTLRAATGLPVGYSDHSLGIEAALAAVALGAAVIEKHITLDPEMPGPDHRASADPQTFSAMVQGIRLVESMLGDGIKAPQPIERNTRDVARRSVVLAQDLPEGHILQANDLCLRRPGTGISPDQLPDLFGCKLLVAASANTVLEWIMVDQAHTKP